MQRMCMWMGAGVRRGAVWVWVWVQACSALLCSLHQLLWGGRLSALVSQPHAPRRGYLQRGAASGISSGWIH